MCARIKQASKKLPFTSAPNCSTICTKTYRICQPMHINICPLKLLEQPHCCGRLLPICNSDVQAHPFDPSMPVMASGETCAPDGDIARRQQKGDRKREERGSGRPRRSLVPTRERETCGLEEEARIARVFGPFANALAVLVG